MITYQITPNTIERQTEKAVLINGMGWLPKSQVRWVETVDGETTYMVMPKWLWAKKGLGYYNNLGTQIAFETCDSEVAEQKDITKQVYS